MDYNKLNVFLEVVRSESVTAAAKVLHRTQSAISQSLHSLEQQLGTKLIEWEGKRLKLTRAGQAVFKTANNRMATINEELSTLLTSDKEVTGCIEIGVLQDHSTNIQQQLLKTIATFRSQHPSVTFNIHFGTSRQIEQALLDHKLDLGLLINFQERHRFHITAITQEEHLIVSSSKLGSVPTIKALLQADLIDIDETFTCLTPWIQKHDPTLIPALDNKHPAIIAPDFTAIKDLVLAHQGIAVLPKYLIEKELKTGKLIQLLPTKETLHVTLDLAIPRGRPLRLCEELFQEELTKQNNRI